MGGYFRNKPLPQMTAFRYDRKLLPVSAQFDRVEFPHEEKEK
jgi:hypothetical protein